ncbi:MAG: ABC transporter permease [Proteobacteria bacterium]|nr:MAG: ABC transporter permease [Pseudomonadota bacterium]PIE17971.1 MAG: ABC transporter permease [Pseudomonadota bacterium]
MSARDDPRGERKPGVLMGAFEIAGQLRQVLLGCVAGALAGRGERGATWRQAFEIGNRSLFFVLLTLAFLAMVSVYQVCNQINRVTGDLSKVGMEFIKLLTHESGPTLTAMMLATRVGAGVAAEIGSMKVTEQIDALRMSGVSPIDYLLVPRFRASLLMTPALALYGGAIALAAGAAVAHYSFGVNPRIFMDFSTVTVGDGVVGLTKAFAFGAAIPVVSGAYGLATRGGSEGVGAATTRAVIGSSLAVLMLDFVLGALGFLIFPPVGVS